MSIIYYSFILEVWQTANLVTDFKVSTQKWTEKFAIKTMSNIIVI